MSTWDPYFIWLDRLVDMGSVFQNLILLDEDLGTPSWKRDFSLKEKVDLFPFVSENMSVYSFMDGMKICIAEKKTHGSDALPIWLWDLGIIWIDKLFQVIKKLSGMMYKPVDS